MRPDQLYVIFFIIIGCFLIISSLDVGLTTAASKKPSTFANSADCWTKVVFGIVAGTGVLYLVNTSSK